MVFVGSKINFAFTLGGIFFLHIEFQVDSDTALGYESIINLSCEAVFCNKRPAFVNKVGNSHTLLFIHCLLLHSNNNST